MRLSKAQQAEMAQAAREFERLGPEDFGAGRPGPAARRRSGHPSLPGTVGVSPLLNTRVPPALHAYYESEAKRRGMTISAVVREALQRVARGW